jgi:hypothetical protein
MTYDKNASRAGDTSLPADNIRRIMPHAADVVIFEGGEGEVYEDNLTIALTALDDAAHSFCTPLLDLRDENSTVQALVRPARPGETPSATMDGLDGLLHLFLLNEAVKMPEDYLDAIPLPVIVNWAEDARPFDLVDGEPVECAVEEQVDEAIAVVAPVGEPVAAVAGEPPNGEEMVGEPAVNGQLRLNASLIIGTETDAFKEALNRPIEVLTGFMYGAGNKRNTLDEGWAPVKMTLLQIIQGFDKTGDAPEFGFSRHTESKNKAGPCVVMGSSIGGARKAKAMKTMHFLGIDIDSGAKLNEVVAQIEKKGIFCLVHTSYNHGKSGLQLKRDEVLRKLGIKGDPTITQIQEYLREHDKSRYEESFIQAVTIKTAMKQVKEGVVIELDTPPLDKMRLIFPLLNPVEIIEQGDTHQEALDDWENAVTGVAHSVLGVHFDTSCTDPSRLFYTPRHAPDSDNWESYIIMGDPLDYSKIPRVKKAQYTKNRDLNAFVQADDSEGPGKIKTMWTPSGADLNKWHSKVGKSRFMLADLLETYCADKIRHAGGEKSGHVHTECPFEHEHTSEGGTGTMAINCIDNSSEYWTWFCHHDSCQGRHKTELLNEALACGWFDEELLVSDEFLLPPDDDEVDEDAEEVRLQKEELKNSPTPDAEPAGPSKVDKLVAAIDFNGSGVERAIRDLYARLVKLGFDEVQKAKLSKELKEKSGLDLMTLKRFWKEAEKDKYTEDEAESAKSAPIITEADFDTMVEYAENRIQSANMEEPRLFQYMERRAEIRPNPYSEAKITLLDRDGFAAFLNRVTRFKARFGDKNTRHVSAPQDVVKQIYYSRPSGLPVLRGLVTSPTFSSSGALISKAGFDAGSGLYYHPSKRLIVPPVSDAPTDTEFHEAKRLLVEEVFADFPLAGMNRDEIVEEMMRGETGIPAMAHLIAFALLPFCREMIDGPTPGHLVVKPTPGTGASLLTEVTSIISTGYVVASMAMPTNKDEMGKTLTSVLANGQNIVFFDNISDKVDSAELASALTAKIYAARLLGKSQTVETEVRCAWILTGNNVQLSTELVRRLIMIDLDAQMTNPEQRSGFKHDDLRGWVEKNRGVLVWACLTIIQNWVARGKPDSGENVLASYENWSRVMGGILAEAGITGFLGNRQELSQSSNLEQYGPDVQLMQLLGSQYDDGQYFRPSAASDYKGDKTVSLIGILNAHNSGDDDPILLQGGGYVYDNTEEFNKYTDGTKVRKSLTPFVDRTYEVEVEGGQRFRAVLRSENDSRNKSVIFKLEKKQINDDLNG